MVHVGVKQERKEDALEEALRWHSYIDQQKYNLDEDTKKRIEDVLKNLGFKEV